VRKFVVTSRNNTLSANRTTLKNKTPSPD